MKNKAILGIDGGGTYTRAAITDTEGNLLSYVKWQGGAFIYKDSKAKENVFNAVHEAVKKANCTLGDVIGVTAGIAGYDKESDLEWVSKLTKIDGLNCPQHHVNDAVIAHRGALLLKPGIISISGTGSVIYGITETEKCIRNYDFHHYSNTAARCLSYDSVYKIIAGETDRTDNDFVNTVFNHFEVNDLSALTKLGSEGFINDYAKRDKLFGDLAPAVTAAALSGSHLAEQICDKVASDIVTGIRLIGACFESESVSAALIGGVANSPVIKNGVKKILNTESNNKNYLLVEPALPAVLGAVIMEMQKNDITLNDQILNNLYEGAETISKSI